MTTTTKPRLTKLDLVGKVVSMIHRGQLDGYLERIMAACNDRRRTVRDELTWRNMEELKPGTRVRVTGRIRPQYLLGCSGVVVERPEGFRVVQTDGVIYVDFKRQFGKRRGGGYRYGPVIGVPAACLEAT